MDASAPEINSFIIRFVHSRASATAPALRGSIRHIQSNQEKPFSHWREVEVFIQRFILLELHGLQGPSECKGDEPCD